SGWATRVESRDLQTPEFVAEVRLKMQRLLEAGADQLVLGCTHYSFLTPLLAPLVAGRAQLVDVAEAVARQAQRLAGASAQGQGRLLLQATARPEQLHASLAGLGLGWLAERCRGEELLARV
ncbi:MAG: aspartate/glutamate racemase family protein, partial [Azospira sp.]|nr:aspartate/glutamate racemase family protein [Azospira sp.]